MISHIGDYEKKSSAQEVTQSILLCSLQLNLKMRFVYLLIWFWLVVLLITFVIVLAYRLVILVAWPCRGLFLNSRRYLGNREYNRLNRICSRNIGDYFLLNRLLQFVDSKPMTDEVIKLMSCEDQQVDENYELTYFS